jgi:DNA-binding transcriptional LysR family regulator
LEDLSLLRTFVRVVEVKSLSEAARQSGLMPATVSKKIATLEGMLHIRLFNRTTRSVQATEAGQRLYERAINVLAELEKAADELANLHEQPEGHLRVTAPPLLGAHRLGPMLPQFLRRHPSITLDVRFSAQTLDLVQEGLDVALRIADEINPNLIAIKLASYKRVFVASPDYIDEHGPPATPEDLREHNCLINRGSGPADEWSFVREGAPLAIKVRGNMSADSAEVVRQAALAGLGITMTSSWFIQEELNTGRLVQLLPEYTPVDQRAIYAVLVQRSSSTRKVAAFVEFLKSCFAGPY